MKIIGVAIQTGGVLYWMQAPARHAQVGIGMIASGLHPMPYSARDQGFVTEDESFVDREEAAKIALASGQCKDLMYPPRLFSEDLW